MSDSADFDIVSPSFHANPFPTLDRMRAEGPASRVRLPIVGRTWLAVTHDACTQTQPTGAMTLVTVVLLAVYLMLSAG